MNPDEFLKIVKNASPQKDDSRMGNISSDYVSGRPKVKFDGESTASTQTYPYLSSYIPVANDRVVLFKVGAAWLILGKVI